MMNKVAGSVAHVVGRKRKPKAPPKAAQENDENSNGAKDNQDQRTLTEEEIRRETQPGKSSEDQLDSGPRIRDKAEPVLQGREKEGEENTDKSGQEKTSVEETGKQDNNVGVLKPRNIASNKEHGSSRLSTNVLDIPGSVYRTVCIKLNRKDEICFSDYRLLYEKLGYDEKVARSLEQGTTPNLTNELLLEWHTTHAADATVERLINLLKEEDLSRMDVVEILEAWVQEDPHSRLSTQVTDIPGRIKSRICLMLNTENTFYRDYRMLGEKLGYDRDKIEGFKQGKTDPTDTLIQKWCETNGPLTVGRLIELMEEEDMKRMDVVMVLKEWIDAKGVRSTETSV